eukprot:COSAG01_NODE_2695_length_7242_cov_4.051519_4_plen_160_part_00
MAAGGVHPVLGAHGRVGEAREREGSRLVVVQAVAAQRQLRRPTALAVHVVQEHEELEAPTHAVVVPIRAFAPSVFLDKNMRYIGKSQVKTSRENEGQPPPQRGDVGTRASVGASGLRQRRRRWLRGASLDTAQALSTQENLSDRLNAWMGGVHARMHRR